MRRADAEGGGHAVDQVRDAQSIGQADAAKRQEQHGCRGQAPAAPFAWSRLDKALRFSFCCCCLPRQGRLLQMRQMAAQ